jgi:3',5'-cyclic AMP phosphodiesterase CpdA
MKIKDCIKTVCFIIVLFACSGIQGQNEKLELPRFAVISDIHFGNNKGKGPVVKVPLALKNILGKGHIDALFVVGDLTDTGKANEYDMLIQVFADKANVPDKIPVYFMMGNHDHIDPVNAITLYTDKLKQPLHQFAEIKGYPFITISPTGVGTKDYNAEAQTFLSEKLASAAQKYPGKPIFVFFHHPLLNTCYGSSTGNWGSDILLPILEPYPQSIVFSGHSHFPIGDPRSIYQDKFTSVNDGSTTYSGVEKGEITGTIHPKGFEDITEGLIVSVLQNGNVEIERWDTFRDEEISPKWTVEAPHNGSRFVYKNRNGLPAPSFSDGVKPIVSDITAKGDCVVTFPQATDNDVVHRYRVDILDGDSVTASFTTFSQFYLNSQMPAELSVRFSELPVDKPLTARVTAEDSYNNQSIPIASESFRVK